MTEKDFWQVIEDIRPIPYDRDKVENNLYQLLKNWPDDKIKAFSRVYQGKMNQAYTWGLWGAGFVINGGCSDDSFTEFRNWLISQGKDIYEKALEAPDDIAELTEIPWSDELRNNCPLLPELDLIAGMIYSERHFDDEDILPLYVGPREPLGESWEEDNDVLAKLYPKLWAKYGKNFV
ncbi:MAG: DUF4240 domain-containing protein [Spirochaetota bacterium]|nr:DUF4240 domain-containing protein [Spirochaetota bacterium]